MFYSKKWFHYFFLIENHRTEQKTIFKNLQARISQIFNLVIEIFAINAEVRVMYL
jgi:hypothetical protein